MSLSKLSTTLRTEEASASSGWRSPSPLPKSFFPSLPSPPLERPPLSTMQADLANCLPSLSRAPSPQPSAASSPSSTPALPSSRPSRLQTLAVLNARVSAAAARTTATAAGEVRPPTVPDAIHNAPAPAEPPSPKKDCFTSENTHHDSHREHSKTNAGATNFDVPGPDETVHADTELHLPPPSHPLQHTWTFFYQSPPTKRPESQPLSSSEYESSLTKIGSVSDVESFCSLFKWVKQPSQLLPTSSVLFFKDHVRPVWEDPRNRNGGKWILTIPKAQILDRSWTWLAMALVGESIDEDDIVMGAVCSSRRALATGGSTVALRSSGPGSAFSGVATASNHGHGPVEKRLTIQVWTSVSKRELDRVNALGHRLLKALDVANEPGMQLRFIPHYSGGSSTATTRSSPLSSMASSPSSLSSSLSSSQSSTLSISPACSSSSSTSSSSTLPSPAILQPAQPKLETITSLTNPPPLRELPPLTFNGSNKSNKANWRSTRPAVTEKPL